MAGAGFDDRGAGSGLWALWLQRRHHDAIFCPYLATADIVRCLAPPDSSCHFSPAYASASHSDPLADAHSSSPADPDCHQARPALPDSERARRPRNRAHCGWRAPFVASGADSRHFSHRARGGDLFAADLSGRSGSGDAGALHHPGPDPPSGPIAPAGRGGAGGSHL